MSQKSAQGSKRAQGKGKKPASLAKTQAVSKEGLAVRVHERPRPSPLVNPHIMRVGGGDLLHYDRRMRNPALQKKSSDSASVRPASSGPVFGAAQPSMVARGRETQVGMDAVASQVGLAGCSLNWAKALVNPFGEFVELPCLPTAPAMMTYRYRNITRGSFTTGSFYGFVCVCPYNGGNNTNTIFTSTGSSYVANSAFGKTPTAGVAGAARTGLPFPAAAFDGIQGRLVGFGLRVRNITQSLNVGGLLTGIICNDDEDLTAPVSGWLTNEPRAVNVPQALSEQTEWSTLVWRPGDMSDLDFHGGAEDFSFSTVPCMGFSATPAGATAQTYEWEAVEFWEFMGRSPSQTLAPPELVSSHADALGVSRVSEALQFNPLTLTAKDWQVHAANSLVDAIAHSDSVAKTVEALAGTAKAVLPVAKMVGSLLGFFGL